MRIAKTVTSVRKEGLTVCIETNAVPIRLLFLTDDILRIRAGFDGGFREASYTLVTTAWEDAMDGVLKEERRRVDPAAVWLVTDPGEKAAILKRFPGALSGSGSSADGSGSATGEMTRDTDGVTLVVGEHMTVLVFHDPFLLRIYDNDGELMHEDIPLMGWQCDSNNRRIHCCAQEPGDRYYGFGEHTGPLNKRQMFLRHAPGDTLGYDPERTDPLYKHIPFYIRLNEANRRAVGYFYHNSWECDFDLGRSHSNYVKHHVTYRTDGGDIDLFLIHGPSMRDVVQRYTDLTGKSAMLPRAALGYLGSSMYYSELPKDADDAILKFVDTAKAEEIPMDGFQLSSGYCAVPTASGIKRCTFTWNRERFKDPAAFFSAMTGRGITVSPNVKPAMLLEHPMYREMAEQGMFAADPETGEPAVGLWWGGPGSYVDFTSEENRKRWKEYLRVSLLEEGVVSIWNDNCEYEGLTDKDARVSYENMGASIGQTKAVMSNLMCKVAQEAILEQDADCRPFVVCRSGFAGIQRYAQTWAGDNYTSWESLRGNITTILGMSLSGVANQGCDIGGFFGPSPEEELFVRWVQHGIFQPRFSIHSTNTDNTVTEPWMYHHSRRRIARAIRFRYALSPYLYSLMRRAHETGLPIMEPFVSAFPEDPRAWDEERHFMEGDGLLVASVLDAGAEEEEIYLPAEHVFYDFYTRKTYAGGQTIRIPVDLDSIPLFLKDGAIVPMAAQAPVNLTSDPVTALRLVCVPPKDGSSRFVFYEDDGVSMAYRKGVYRRTEITLTAGDQTILSFAPEGDYDSPVTQLEADMVCPGRAPVRVWLGEQELPRFLYRPEYKAAESGWYYSSTLRSVQIRFAAPKDDCTVTVDFGQADLLGM